MATVSSVWSCILPVGGFMVKDICQLWTLKNMLKAFRIRVLIYFTYSCVQKKMTRRHEHVCFTTISWKGGSCWQGAPT